MRDWSLNNTKPGTVCHLSQRAELHGVISTSLRSCDRDLAESDVTAETRVWSTGTVVPGPEHRAVCLKVRSETKTGQRSVPSWVGEVIDGLKGPNQQ